MGNKKNSWRDELDLLIEENLKELINETKAHDTAIRKSDDKSKAQIWVALALLNNKINSLSSQKKPYEKKIEKKELNKILKTLETL